MKKVFILLLIALPFVSCSKKEVFNAENIIPTPKKMIVNDDKLHYIDDITVLETDDNLLYPQNKDEYFLKSENGNVIIEGNEVWARQTLAQLKDEKGRIPDVEIHDWSAYPFRALFLCLTLVTVAQIVS